MIGFGALVGSGEGLSVPGTRSHFIVPHYPSAIPEGAYRMTAIDLKYEIPLLCFPISGRTSSCLRFFVLISLCLFIFSEHS